MDLVAFEVAGHACAVDAARVVELLAVPPVTRVPGAPAALRGVVNVRGQVVAVADVALLLGAAPSPLGSTSLLVIVEVESDAARFRCALLVDSVTGMVPADGVVPRASCGPLEGADFVQGFLEREGRTLVVLDLDALLDLDAIRRPRGALPREAPGPSHPLEPLRSGPLVAPAETASASAPAPASVAAAAQRATAAPDSGARASASPWRDAVPVSARRERAARSTAPPPLAGRPPRPLACADGRDPAAGARPRAGAPPAVRREPVAAPAAAAPAPAAPSASSSARPPRRLRPLAATVVATALVAGLLAIGRTRDDAPGGAERSTGVMPQAQHVAVAPREEAPAAPPAPARPEPPAPPRTAPDAPPPPGFRAVEVRRGDTLWGLAARHRGDAFSWPVLYRANGQIVRDPDLIRPGQRLVVPDRGATR